jgi:hypothetical protein
MTPGQWILAAAAVFTVLLLIAAVVFGLTIVGSMLRAPRNRAWLRRVRRDRAPN